MRDRLPKEFERELDYRGLLDTLALLEGEYVGLALGGLSSRRPLGGRAARLGVAGQLRRITYSWADVFAVGESGRLLLYEPDFVSAALWTYDGNDFFRITIQLGDVTFLIGDESELSDEFEM